MTRTPVVALFALASLSGCGEPLRYWVHQHRDADSVGLVGRESAVTFFVTTHGGDQLRTQMPSDPRCVVSSPSGAVVECRIRAGPSLQDEDDGTLTALFTPTEVGAHDVAVFARQDESDSARLFAFAPSALARVELPRACRWVERLGSGAWLCDDAVLAPTARDGGFVEGGVVARLWAERASSAGDVLWAFNSGELSRFRQLGDGGLAREPGLGFDVGAFNAAAVLARRDEAIVVHHAGLVRVAFTDAGTLVSQARAAFPPQPEVAALLTGDAVLVASSGTSGARATDLCVYDLAGQGVSQRACSTWPETLLGLAQGGAWLGSTGTLRRLRFVGPALDEGLVAELPWLGSMPEPYFGGGMRTIAPGVMPSVGQGEIQRWGIIDFRTLTFNDDFAWTSFSGATSTTVYMR